MLILEPMPQEEIWGGQRLIPYCKTVLSNIGHLYSIICSPSVSNNIIYGSKLYHNFFEYYIDNKRNYGLEKFEQFPLRIALVDAADHLSIQVHPNDALASQLEGMPYGKNESLYILIPPDLGYIYNGCSCKNNMQLKQMLDSSNLKNTVARLAVQKDDYLFIEAGTVHAICGGTLALEIEENVDVTYRIFDFERSDKNGLQRQLHLEEAYQCIDTHKRSRIIHNAVQPIRERFYTTQRITKACGYSNESNTLHFLTFLAPAKVLNVDVIPGMCLLMEPGEFISDDLENVILAFINERK